MLRAECRITVSTIIGLQSSAAWPRMAIGRGSMMGLVVGDHDGVSY